MSRSLLLAALAAVAIPLVLVLLVRLVEPRLAFFPARGEWATPGDAGVAFDSIDLRTSDGERLRAWWIPHPAARATVVYFHGNGGNLSVWADILVGVHARGFAVFAVDYRGYGLSTGSPSEQGLYRDVDAVVGHAARLPRPAGTPLVYWGRSLGSTMAAYAATRRRPDGVVLEAGFPDARSLLRGSPLALLAWASSYRFPTTAFMREARVPALVIHGTADSVIPFPQGVALHTAIRPETELLAIRGGDHNDASPREPATYWNGIDTFILKLGR